MRIAALLERQSCYSAHGADVQSRSAAFIDDDVGFCLRMYLKDTIWNQMYIGQLCSTAIYELFTNIIGEDCHINQHALVSQDLDDARIDRWPCDTDGARHNSKDTEHNAKRRHAHRVRAVPGSRSRPSSRRAAREGLETWVPVQYRYARLACRHCQ